MIGEPALLRKTVYIHTSFPLDDAPTRLSVTQWAAFVLDQIFLSSLLEGSSTDC